MHANNKLQWRIRLSILSESRFVNNNLDFIVKKKHRVKLFLFIKAFYNHDAHMMAYKNIKSPAKTKELYEQGFLVGTASVPFKGIRGKPAISTSIDFPDGVLIDYMHLVCLGLFRTFFALWFGQKHSRRAFYLGMVNLLIS